MSYSIRVLEGGVEVVHLGRMSVAEIDNAQRESAQCAVQHGTANLLVDLRNADLGDLSYTDVFNANTVYSTVFGSTPNLRLAFVVQTPQLDTMKFAETVARNRGTDCRVFLAHDEAARWLAEAQ